MPSPSSVPAELLAELAAALGRVRAQWYLFGAQAVVIWGRPRLTADIDVTVRLVPEDPERLARSLTDAGFVPRFGASDDFLRRTRVMPFVHTSSGFPLDVVLAGPGLEELFLSRAVPVPIGDIVVPVIKPEDLVATKILAGREKDLEDVRSVLCERQDMLDLALIRTTLTSLEEALGQSDLLPVFERLLTDLETRRR